ncbi:MAG: hypothetical protein H6637_05430 [Ardenticatenales bacterium]|nr:hypothetical protein [Ardenticatenales bacterium]
MHVEATEKAGNRVAFWERDSAHPDGEVWVSRGSGTVEVGSTPALLRAVAAGLVREVEAPAASQEGAPSDGTQEVPPGGNQETPPAVPEGYEDWTVGEVEEHVASAEDAEALGELRAYEVANKNRKGALEAIDARLEALQANDEA